LVADLGKIEWHWTLISVCRHQKIIFFRTSAITGTGALALQMQARNEPQHLA
jgi:hypothetical protein